MEIDTIPVSGHELRQRLVSSGIFYTSDAVMIITEMVTKGELKVIFYDTFVRVQSKIEVNEEIC